MSETNSSAEKVINDFMDTMKKEAFGVIADTYVEFRKKGIPVDEAIKLTLAILTFFMQQNKEKR